ncbi:MAG TPA: YwbE family protein [Methanoregulaceae archaeon]|nr:YwbE family protein [Methanoregulaceae archaeon]HPD74928.1 YwbE family protein [Methanoregulaceae archaeon]
MREDPMQPSGPAGTGTSPDPRKRSSLRQGVRVKVVQKQDQRTGTVTEGTVAEILTSSPFHPHGIKVRLSSGKVGRVVAVLTGPDG